MRRIRHSRRILITSATFALTSGVIFPGLASASAGSSVEIPAMPSLGASMLQWQNWATQWDSQLQAADPSSLITSLTGCTNTSIALSPVVSTGLGGIPKGIVTELITVTGTCTH